MNIGSLYFWNKFESSKIMTQAPLNFTWATSCSILNKIPVIEGKRWSIWHGMTSSAEAYNLPNEFNKNASEPLKQSAVKPLLQFMLAKECLFISLSFKLNVIHKFFGFLYSASTFYIVILGAYMLKIIRDPHIKLPQILSIHFTTHVILWGAIKLRYYRLCIIAYS